MPDVTATAIAAGDSGCTGAVTAAIAIAIANTITVAAAATTFAVAHLGRLPTYMLLSLCNHKSALLVAYNSVYQWCRFR